MTRNIDALFKESAPPGPDRRLLDSVMTAVARARRRDFFARRLPLLGSGLAMSGAAAAYAIALAVAEASRSGLAGFLSMIVTDTGAVIASWQDYILSLIDALPVAPLGGVCAALFVFFLLLRRLDGALAHRQRLHHI
ncbi:MAG TPA: hypothetical protein VLC10_02235 [Patescibacteria group bacterium]|nr:hypothetical protein [Patescibacteria group bacterium]